MVSEKDGKKLLKAARNCVVYHFNHKVFRLEGFPDKLGVFVTIHSFPSHELRGCIGFPEPVFSLNDALPRAALSAAFQDPRFFPLEEGEMNSVVFEVSVLTKPELVKVKNSDGYISEIKVGRDGLIADDGIRRGLLLPIVAVEYNWGVEEFLKHTCSKAGLPQDAWKDVGKCRIYKFQAQVFSEKKPGVM